MKDVKKSNVSQFAVFTLKCFLCFSSGHVELWFPDTVTSQTSLTRALKASQGWARDVHLCSDYRGRCSRKAVDHFFKKTPAIWRVSVQYTAMES